MKLFKQIIKLDQYTLKESLKAVLCKYYDNVISKDGFLYAKGSDIMVTAHMDTVHKEMVRKIKIKKDKKGNHILWSPQGIGGDDRCGIWIILNILRKTSLRPTILFCEDEEIGRVGSKKFTKAYPDFAKELRYIIELDRAGNNEAVYYECGNEDFYEYIEGTTGFVHDYGSYSDITELCEKGDIAGVNLSVGYYHQHTLEETVNFEEMENSYHITLKLLTDTDERRFDHQPIQYTWNKRNVYGWYDNYGLYDDYEREGVYEICFNGKDGEDYFCTEATSDVEAIGYWLIEHSDRCYNDIIDIYSW